MESNDIGHSLEMLPCQFCCRLFRTSFGLLSHQRDFHHHLDIGISDLDSSIEKDNYTCKTCNRTLNNYIGLLAHQRDTHGIEPQYFLPQSLSLTTRIGTTESIVSLPGNFSGIIALPYRCSRCRRSFRTMLDLRAHEKDSHSISIVAATTDPTFSGDMIPCDRCRRVFRTMFGLYTHKRDAHGIIPDQISVEGGEQIPCVQCECLFNSNRELQIHLGRVHAHKERISCSLCSKSFLSTIALDQHTEAKHQN